MTATAGATVAAPLTIFGIRHHGPGSARSLGRALADLAPDCLLVEGPPDADGVLSLAADADMRPPVALLVYAVEEPRRAVSFPLAEFSPEWQAIRYGLARGIPVRFCDLPVSHRLALDKQAEEAIAAARPAEEAAPAAGEDAPAAEAEPAPVPAPGQRHPRHDPLRWLAEAAGYGDSERWWEHMVELRREATDLFAAVGEAMTALRAELPAPGGDEGRLLEDRREAHMRTAIRAAAKEGFRRIAVVCGAWHAPLLARALEPAAGKGGGPPAGPGLPCADARADQATLKGLPRLKVAATWIPWTSGRLAQESGYGAGVESPGWYAHLFTHSRLITEHWLTRVAALLRGADLDASPAQTIEAVRLAECLAALRGRPLPGLAEMNEAIQATFCFGSPLPMRLIREELILGRTLGSVPAATPSVPLWEDVAREQKRLRLPPRAAAELLELDLRKETDLARSRLLHRLDLVGVPWGSLEQARGKGTFREAWTLEWRPEFVIAVIEASRWGNTLAAAAAGQARSTADAATDLPALTGLIDRVLLAELPDAAAHVMRRIQDQAAVTSDIGHLLEALPPLASVLRYGTVRQADAGPVRHVVAGIVARVCVGLGAACGSLNDDAAREMLRRVAEFHRALALLQEAEWLGPWHGALARLTDLPQLHGLLAGHVVRLLLDAGACDPATAATRLGLALSVGGDPAHAAAWIEGFLAGSGSVLVHDDGLWSILDGWVSGLAPDVFTRVLPLLRRTFSGFPAPERRLMGERVRRGGATPPPAAGGGADDHDPERAARALPLLRLLLAPLPEPAR